MGDVFNFIGIFYMVIFLVAVSLFIFEKDDWYKMLFFAFSVFMFSLLIYFANFQGDVDNGYPSVSGKYVVSDLNIDSLVGVDEETFTRQDYVMHKFTSIDSRVQNSFYNTNFCFYYNNSDALSNVVQVVKDTDVISDYVFLENNTEGFSCTNIDSVNVKKDSVLGVYCVDCVGGNPLKLPRFNGDLISDIHIINVTDLNYSISNSFPHAYYIEYVSLPIKQSNKSLNIFNWALGLFTLLFGSRYIWKMFYEEEDGFNAFG